MPLRTTSRALWLRTGRTNSALRTQASLATSMTLPPSSNICTQSVPGVPARRLALQYVRVRFVALGSLPMQRSEMLGTLVRVQQNRAVYHNDGRRMSILGRLSKNPVRGALPSTPALPSDSKEVVPANNPLPPPVAEPATIAKHMSRWLSFRQKPSAVVPPAAMCGGGGPKGRVYYENQYR